MGAAEGPETEVAGTEVDGATPSDGEDIDGGPAAGERKSLVLPDAVRQSSRRNSTSGADIARGHLRNTVGGAQDG